MGRGVVAAAALALAVVPARAQVAPAAPPAATDDTPTVKVGGNIFTDFTYTAEPVVTAPDGSEFNQSAFNVTRAYVNVTGSLSRLFEFRITPDVAREAGTGSSLGGSLTFRLKYAYGQLNLDRWLGDGAWVRLGMQQTPWIDFIDGVYRYRFQGPVLADREGYIVSSDLGLSARYHLPGEYGDLHAGVYNGETFARPEANDQKAIQVRATLRPFPRAGALKGLRLTGFYHGDNAARGLARNRLIGSLTFEHARFTVSADVMATEDQPAPDGPQLNGRGVSVFLIPKLKVAGERRSGVEALLRYDDLQPDTAVDAHRRRYIAGLAYWFPLPKGVSGAILADTERVTTDDALLRPDERRYSLHAALNF